MAATTGRGSDTIYRAYRSHFDHSTHLRSPSPQLFNCDHRRRLLDEVARPAEVATILRMVHDDEKLALDTQRLDVYLTSLQAEVEAKVRRVHRFREHMHHLDAGPTGKIHLAQRERAARALITQVDQMLETNLLVRELLQDLRAAAQAVLTDVLES